MFELSLCRIVSTELKHFYFSRASETISYIPLVTITEGLIIKASKNKMNVNCQPSIQFLNIFHRNSTSS